METTARRSHAEADRPLAKRIGGRLRLERHRAGLTQRELAEGRYTKAYVSALENGLVKPSMAALNYFAERLGVPVTAFVGDPGAGWTRLEADVRLASGDWMAAADAYEALIAEAPRAVRPELLLGLAEAYCRLERATEAVRVASEAASLFDERGQRMDAGWARYWHAFALYELEQSDDARRLLARIETDLGAAGTPDSPDLRVRIAIARAMIDSRDDDPERALASLEGARAFASELDDRRRATFLFSLALSYREVGDLEAAVVTANQSLSLFRAAAAELEAGSLENELALVYLGLGQLERAHEHSSLGRAVFERLGNERWLAHITETEAQIALVAGDIETAVAKAEQARDGARRAANRKAEVSALVTLARALRARGDTPDGVRALEEAADVARKHGRRGQLQIVLGDLADAVAEGGDLERAFALSQEALRAHRLPSMSPFSTRTRSVPIAQRQDTA